MGLGELLDRIRGLYTAQFMGAVQKLARRPGVTLLSEVALRNEAGEAVVEGVLGLPIRVDLAALVDGAEAETSSVDSEKLVSFQPISFVWQQRLTVRLAPFHWDSLTARVAHAAPVVDWGPLIAWYWRWFREDEDGAGELLGVIHFLSDPTRAGGSLQFTADLGSAPVEAFEELLDAFAAIGAENVAIGSTDAE